MSSSTASPKCAAGGCQCVPACPPQLARVQAYLDDLTNPRTKSFLAALHVPADTLPVTVAQPPPKGHAWLCAACQQLQAGPGAHCGYRVLLVETKDMTRDAGGRVTRATMAQIPGHYRAPRAP